MQAQLARFLVRGGLVVVLLCGFLIGPRAAAQDIYFVDSTGEHTRAAADPARFAKRADAPSMALKSGNLTWNVYYVDVLEGSGVGFDDPSSGSARRAVVESVLSYINDVLSENTGAAIEVVFNASQTDGGGYLSSCGTMFRAVSGYQGGFCFEHITTGTDPSLAYYDIYCTVDFGYNWYTGTGTPGSGQFDFFSVMLHEMTHGLGFLSLSNSSGGSTIGNGAFSYYDKLIETGNGHDCWNDSTAEFIGQSSWLVGQDGGLVMNGPNAIAAFGSLPPLYAPSTFQSGSSLSHWNTGSKIAGNAVMEPGIAPREVVREYAPVEIGALADLGYDYVSGGAATAAADFDAATYSVSEGGGSVTLTVELSSAPGLGNSASVDYATSDGSAEAGSDYTGTSGTLNFDATDIAKAFFVSITEDGAIESNETFTVTLSNPQGCALAGVNNPATLTIVDNDVDSDGDGISDYDETNGTLGYVTDPNDADTDGDGVEDLDEINGGTDPTDPNDPPSPEVDFSSASYSVSEDGGSAVVTVVLTDAPGSGRTASVDYATSDGSATAGSDYTGTSGTLNFSSSESSKTFSVAIIEDGGIEESETVTLTLSNAVGCALAGVNNPATLTIVDNDVDSDGDGISDYDETNGTLGYVTDPNDADTDGDGVEDLDEINGGTDPTDPNDPVPPVPEVAFSAGSYIVGEGESSATVTVTLNMAPGEGHSAQIDYNVSSSSAAAGSDFVAASGTLTFGSMDTAQSFEVSILEDGVIEDDETVALALSNPQDCELAVENSQATLTIVDNDVDTDGDGISDYDETNGTLGYVTDPNDADTDGDGLEDLDEINGGTDPTDKKDPPRRPKVDFNKKDYHANESAGFTTVIVSLSEPAGESVSVQFMVTPWEAEPGMSDAVVSETLVFGPDDTSLAVDVPVSDPSKSGGETVFTLTLCDPVGCDLAGENNPATLVVADDITDSDGDGISDYDETNGTLGYVTDPNNADTDGDGVNDLDEINQGADPTEPGPGLSSLVVPFFK